MRQVSSIVLWYGYACQRCRVAERKGYDLLGRDGYKSVEIPRPQALGAKACVRLFGASLLAYNLAAILLILFRTMDNLRQPIRCYLQLRVSP